MSSAKTMSASSFCAFALKTICVSGTDSPITTGTRCLIIPAFSAAIAPSVLPRNWVWSSDILVIIDRIGVMMFVQSSLPPKPTSMMAMSTFCSAKCLKASAVVSSKKEGCSGSKKARSCSTKSITSCSEIISPLTLIRSRKSTR